MAYMIRQKEREKKTKKAMIKRKCERKHGQQSRSLHIIAKSDRLYTALVLVYNTHLEEHIICMHTHCGEHRGSFLQSQSSSFRYMYITGITY